MPKWLSVLRQQRSQPLLVYREGSQELHRRRVFFQRHRMDGPPHACPAVVAAGGRGGFSGPSGRRRADNDAGVHHSIHATLTAAAVIAGNVTSVTVTAVTSAAVTAVTAATVTVGNITAVTVTAVTSAAVTAVTAATVIAGIITAVTVTSVTSAAVTAVTAATVAPGNVTVVTAATVTALSVAVLGGAAGVWPYPLEDDPVFRHADDALLGNAGEAASHVASEKRRGFQSQRWASVHCGQEEVSVDAEYVWSD